MCGQNHAIFGNRDRTIAGVGNTTLSPKFSSPDALPGVSFALWYINMGVPSVADCKSENRLASEESL